MYPTVSRNQARAHREPRCLRPTALSGEPLAHLIPPGIDRPVPSVPGHSSYQICVISSSTSRADCCCRRCLPRSFCSLPRCIPDCKQAGVGRGACARILAVSSRGRSCFPMQPADGASGLVRLVHDWLLPTKACRWHRRPVTGCLYVAQRVLQSGHRPQYRFRMSETKSASAFNSFPTRP